MATKKKKETVKELNHLFQDSQVLIFTDYRGLTVSDITSLRRQLRDKGVEYHVTKNTLSELAATRSGMEAMAPMLDGPTAIAFVGDDIPGAAKVLTDFVRTSRILQIRGGLMGKSVLTTDQVSDLTKIKSREEYLSLLLGAMRGPIQSFANVLNAPLQSFMNVLNARLDQVKEGAGGATDAPAEAARVLAENSASTTETEPVESEAAPAPAEEAPPTATETGAVEAATEEATPPATEEHNDI